MTNGEFPCSRCGRTVTERFSGPSAGRRDDLRARIVGERRSVEAAVYEPKMSVTPSAVALKAND